MPVPMPARRPRRPGSIAKARANRHACVSSLCFMGNALMENRHGLLMENRHGLAVAARPTVPREPPGGRRRWRLSMTCSRPRAPRLVPTRPVMPGASRQGFASAGLFLTWQDAATGVGAACRLLSLPAISPVSAPASGSRRPSPRSRRLLVNPGQSSRQSSRQSSGGVEELRHPSHWRLLAVASYNLIRLPKLPEQGPSTGHKCVHSPLRSPKWPSRRSITRPQTRTYGCPKPKNRRSKSFFNNLLGHIAINRLPKLGVSLIQCSIEGD